MSWRHVERPAPVRTSLLEVSFASVVATAVLALVYSQALVTRVTIDGTRYRLRAGSTVADAASLGLLRARAGHLMSVNGNVIDVRGGGEASVLVGGLPAPPERRLEFGDVVTSVQGADRTETTTTVMVEVPQETVVRGRGPFVKVLRKGKPGLVEEVRGAISGVVVASRKVEESSPTVVSRTSPDGPKKIAALTFDDGPWPRSTDAILKVLAAEKVPATFFVIGSQARRFPALIRRQVREGHEVGNHTMSHRKLVGPKVGRLGVRNEMVRNADAVRDEAGVSQRWFRPPGGGVTSVVVDEAKRAGMEMVLWDVDPQDWRRPGAGNIVNRVMRQVKPGAVILLHDGGGDRTQTIQALPWIIRKLKAEGYTFVTLERLEAAGG